MDRIFARLTRETERLTELVEALRERLYPLMGQRNEKASTASAVAPSYCAPLAIAFADKINAVEAANEALSTYIRDLQV